MGQWRQFGDRQRVLLGYGSITASGTCTSINDVDHSGLTSSYHDGDADRTRAEKQQRELAQSAGGGACARIADTLLQCVDPMSLLY